MEDKRIAFIGAGNMASAIIRGIISQGLFLGDQIMVSAPSQSSRDRMAADFGVKTTADNCQAAAFGRVLVLAVKPKVLDEVILQIRDALAEDTLIISIVAGKSLKTLEGAFGRPISLVRVMPNTPAMVGEAMSALTPNGELSKEDMALAVRLFEALGRAEVVPENLMDAVTGLSGSSPAYIYMLIEAMADAGVASGLPRSQAYTFAAQAVLGSAKMVLETGLVPGQLKDQVTSPGGTTIAGLKALEEGGFRGLVMDGILAAVKKSEEMKG